MAITCYYAFKLHTFEELTGLDGASSPLAIHDVFDKTGTLNASSTPPITKIINKIITLVAGAKTIDLTTETGTGGVVQDGTGLKVRAIRVEPLGANNIVMAEGASNGYALLPTAKTIYTGGLWQEFFGSGAPTIAAGDRQLDFTGTGTQQFRLTILMG